MFVPIVEVLLIRVRFTLSQAGTSNAVTAIYN